MARGYYGLRRQLVRWRCGRILRRASSPPSFDPASVHRILLACMGLLGDTVMCLSALAELRRLFPKAHISAVATSQNRELLSQTPYIDAYYSSDQSPFPLWPERRAAWHRLTAQLHQDRFDLAIALLGDDYLPLFVKLGIPWRVAVQESALAELGTHLYSVGPPWAWGPEERLGALRCLSLSVRSCAPELHPAPAAGQSVTSLLKRRGVGSASAVVVVHPFGRERHQWLPAETTAKAIKLLQQSTGLRAVVVGGAAERGRMRAMGYTIPSDAINLVGELSISELCALMARSPLVITTDSGPLHLGVALKRPTLGLLRAIRPEASRWYGPALETLCSADRTSCGTGCRWDRCGTWPCRQLAKITPEAIVSRARVMLDAQDLRRTDRVDLLTSAPAIHGEGVQADEG